jgi:hypothetical protein
MSTDSTTRRFTFDLEDTAAGLVLSITHGVRVVRTERYHVEPEDREGLGRAWKIRKFFTKEPYVVVIDPTSICTCRGFIEHRHCKHCEGLRAVAHLLPRGTHHDSDHAGAAAGHDRDAN